MLMLTDMCLTCMQQVVHSFSQDESQLGFKWYLTQHANGASCSNESLTVLDTRICEAIAHSKALQVDLCVAGDVLVVLEDSIGHSRHLGSTKRHSDSRPCF